MLGVFIFSCVAESALLYGFEASLCGLGACDLFWDVPGTETLKLTFNGKRGDLERLARMMHEDLNLNEVSEGFPPKYKDPAPTGNGKAGKRSQLISDSRLREYRDLLRTTGTRKAWVYGAGCYLFSGYDEPGIVESEAGGYAYLDYPPAKVNDWTDTTQMTQVAYRPLSGTGISFGSV